MVTPAARAADPAPDPATLPDTLAAGLDDAGRARVARAAAFATTLYGESTLGTGEPAVAHAAGLVANLVLLGADADTRVAGLLFAAPTFLANAGERITGEFGPTVATLVAGVSTLNRLRVVTRSLASDAGGGKGGRGPDRGAQVETLRKMLLAMVEDLRVVLIRLASRTQTLRFLARTDTADRTLIARETLDIYAPLANRLGVWQLKWELEDLAFRFLEPDTYTRLARALDERRAAREAFITGAIGTLAAALAAAGLAAEVSGRPKHLYSIHNKMRQKGLALAGVHDLRGLRVLVPTVADCYTALGVVHDLWTPIAAEFDDYIARPKPNGYQSLHTAVTAADGRPLEVQIRTRDMHRDAELGVAAHWRYKEGGGGSAADERIAWLRQVLAWRDEVVAGADWQEQSKQAARDDTVYVLTPQGRVVDLPRGATPIDFAYALHSDLGHRCRGAKVDGAMVPLDYPLRNGQRVEVIAAKSGGPSRDWLTQPGFLASNRARSKVRQYFHAEERARTVAAGRAIVEKEIQREGAGRAKLEQLARDFGFADPEEFFAAVGREAIGPKALQQALRPPAAPAAPPPDVVTRQGRADESGSGVLVEGIGRLMTQLARCCRPLPPDPIRGFVTRGKGISIHRADCRSLAALAARQPERLTTAAWGDAPPGVYSADILVEAQDRQGLLRDVSDVLSRERLNVTAVSTRSRQHVAQMAFTVEVDSLDQLQRTLKQVGDVRGVISARRR